MNASTDGFQSAAVMAGPGQRPTAPQPRPKSVAPRMSRLSMVFGAGVDRRGPGARRGRLALRLGRPLYGFDRRVPHALPDRLAHAPCKQLLSEGNRSLADVAEQVGYESEYAFNRAFKRQVGEPPASWRKKTSATHASQQ